jgi:hypothetical protein
MLARSTWGYVALYAAFTAHHLGFVSRVGTPFEAGAPAAITSGEAGTKLQALRVSGDRALAGVQVDGKPEMWIVDWSRSDDWLNGQTHLSDLRLARGPAEEMPEQWFRSADRWVLLMSSEAPTLLRWAPPNAPLESALPKDVAWIREDGSPITTPQLDAQLPARVRAMPGLALRSDHFALVRERLPIDLYTGEPSQNEENLLAFDANDGRFLKQLKTYKLAGVVAARDGIFVFTENEGTSAELVTCNDSGCATRIGGQARAGLASITRADAVPELERMALCTNEPELLFFRWSLADEDTTLLARARLDRVCTTLRVLDASRVLIGDEQGWSVRRFQRTRGYLR